MPERKLQDFVGPPDIVRPLLKNTLDRNCGISSIWNWVVVCRARIDAEHGYGLVKFSTIFRDAIASSERANAAEQFATTKPFAVCSKT